MEDITLLDTGIRIDNVDMIKNILSSMPNVCSIINNPNPEYPLICTACLYKRKETFDLLMSLGANPRIKNDLLLPCAVIAKDYNTIKMLLELGVDPNIVLDPKYLRHSSYSSLYTKSVTIDNKNSFIVMVIHDGDLDILQLLIAYGFDLSVDDDVVLRLLSNGNYVNFNLEKTAKFLIYLLNIKIYTVEIITATLINMINDELIDLAKIVLGHNYAIIHQDIIRNLQWKKILYSNSTILFLLNNFDFSNCQTEMHHIALNCCKPSNSTTSIDILKNLIQYGLDLEPYSYKLTLLSLYYDDIELLNLLKENINVDIVFKIINQKLFMFD